MGYSMSWLMVKGKDRDYLLNELRLEATGRSGESSDFRIAGHHLPDGAYLLVLDQCDHAFVSEKRLAQISVASEALGCSIEEHVMYVHATYWENGRNLWSLKHEGDRPEGRYTIIASGSPPRSFQALRDEYAAKQTSDPDVDWYFEMPLALAKQLSGFKHDETNPTLDGTFEELRSITETSSDRSWWKFWKWD